MRQTVQVRLDKYLSALSLADTAAMSFWLDAAFMPYTPETNARFKFFWNVVSETNELIIGNFTLGS